MWSVRTAERQTEDRGTLLGDANPGRVADAGRGLQHRSNDAPDRIDVDAKLVDRSRGNLLRRLRSKTKKLMQKVGRHLI